MKYFKLQISNAETKENFVEEVIADNRITTHEEYGKGFIESVNPNDIVLVHKGNAPHYLVKVLYKIFDGKEVNGVSFGHDYKIHVLSRFKDVKQIRSLFPKDYKIGPNGTFTILKEDSPTKDTIVNWYNYINELNNMTNTIDLLKLKKQIILQGPPGTGKTRLAKQIVKELTINQLLEDSEIINLFKVGQNIRSSSGSRSYVITKIKESSLEYRRETDVLGELKFIDIRNSFKNKKWLTGIKNGNDSYDSAFAKHIFEHRKLSNIDLIQFHPSYSYEDFVRGITVKGGEKGVEYVTENRTLAHIAKEAHQNYIDSKKGMQEVSHEKWLNDQFDEFKEFLQSKIDQEGPIQLTKAVSLSQVGVNYFTYEANTWNDYIKYSTFLTLFKDAVFETSAIRKLHNIDTRASYYNRVLALFSKFMEDRQEPVSSSSQVELKNYVLIIDEINRANLSSVLGELIYALEYRGEPVKSMYEKEDEGNDIILPPNLYIIGTMNTADRSVGQIDYAIRRRFAFVDVLPKVLTKEQLNQNRKEDGPVLNFATDVFHKVANLFVDNSDNGKASMHLSEEFETKDVQLGHSYFIYEEGTDFNLKLEYEIKPILKEYVADGILKKSALDEIGKLA